MFISGSVAETEAAGVRMAQDLGPGDAIALVGDLGSGKTEFVKGVVRGLGSKAPVTSPTFTLVHEYLGGRMPVYHFDFYRLENPDAVQAIGFDEYLFGSGVTLIEWANRFADAIPTHAQWIYFKTVSVNERAIEFK